LRTAWFVFRRKKGLPVLGDWRNRIAVLRAELRILRLAAADPRVPWYTKALAAAVVGYALSPVDLIPDFIPVLGWLDDLILVPAGFWLAVKMIPPEVWEDCCRRAGDEAKPSGAAPDAGQSPCVPDASGE
jgi:uncharacterized membrane protein YkvA (DUF1232 family)